MSPFFAEESGTRLEFGDCVILLGVGCSRAGVQVSRRAGRELVVVACAAVRRRRLRYFDSFLFSRIAMGFRFTSLPYISIREKKQDFRRLYIIVVNLLLGASLSGLILLDSA